MQRLLEVLRDAEARPDATAADQEVRDQVWDLVLGPVEALVVDAGLRSVKTGKGSTDRPQFIAEYRVVTPERDQLHRGLRVALGNAGSFDIGVTVCQAWADTTRQSRRLYPAHIRWGAWSHTPRVAEKIAGPFRAIARRLDWPETSILDPRPITNMPAFTLSMLGKPRREAELSESSLDALIAEIADDILALEQAVRRDPA